MKKLRIISGFTMIEMLVVIAIIAILAALLFPTISAAKNKARRANCLNNLRQINLGVRMYSDDSNDATPSPGTVAGSTNVVPFYSGYKQLMKNYVGLKGASSPQDRPFACPADNFYPDFFSTNPPSQYTRASLHDQAVFDYSSYAFNGGDNATRTSAAGKWKVPGLTGLKFSAIKHPDRTILIAETSTLAPWSWHDSSPDLLFNDAKNMVSFVDGHVSYIKIHWNGKNPIEFAFSYDPPAGYEYQWSRD